MTKSQRIAIVCFIACFVLQGIGLFAMIAVTTWSRGAKLLDSDVSERALGYTTDALRMPAALCVISLGLLVLMMCVSPIWTYKKTSTNELKTADMLRFVLPFLGVLMDCILTANICGLYAGYQYAIAYERTFSFVPYEDRARIAISSYNVTLILVQAGIVIWLTMVNLKVAFAKQQRANTNTPV